MKRKSNPIEDSLQLGQLLMEKCALKEAGQASERALKLAKKAGDYRSMMSALAGLIRIAGESLDTARMEELEKDLDRLMRAHPREIPPMAWYCKGAIARYADKPRVAQRAFHRYLKAVRLDKKPSSGALPITRDEHFARAWLMIATTHLRRGKSRRSEGIVRAVLQRWGGRGYRTVDGMSYHLLGTLAEGRKEFSEAFAQFQKAHAAFLGEHNWFYHLWVLYAYARISRQRRDYPQAYGYLELMDKACSGPEFAYLRREIQQERERLQQDAVDLLIDSRKGVVKTRDGSSVSLRKQYVLLHILEALSQAHGKRGEDSERGLSKAEIIESVWQERYKPEAHDNKLYYNINRLRKLIEPNMRQPRYLLNSKDGYRLAPGLRVHFVKGEHGK